MEREKNMRFLAIVIAVFYLTASVALGNEGKISPGPGAAFFHRGHYAEAYQALWPSLQAGDPEAAFYSLIIRRNGLDGRAQADQREMDAIWKILADKADDMRRGLRNRLVDDEVKDAYRCALAQLEYFGEAGAPEWPPVTSMERARRLRRSLSILAPAAGRFTPAMNFRAYLDCEDKYYKGAFKHIIKAAEKGDFLAMGNLAWLYREGLGTDKYDLRAAHWARQGCDSTPPVARNLNEVGYCYESGRGVSQDMIEAAVWYEKGAKQGYPSAVENSKRLKNKGAGGSSPALDNRILF